VDTDDQALVERCRGGDVAAFEPLVEKYRQRVWRLAYNVLREQEEAWDVAQEAFIRAWQALPSFRGQSAFYTWLFRIAMNVAQDRLRQRGARGRAFGTERVPEEDMDRVMVDADPRPDETAARAEQRMRIRQALDTLSESHRAIIMLSDLEGLSYREIAEVLDIPMGTVMSRLHNARKRLRDALGPLLLAILVLLCTLAAATPSAAEEIVRFGARVVYAGDQPPPSGMRTLPMDERLNEFIPKLKKIFSYRMYASLERYRAEVAVGATQAWSVPGDRQLELTADQVANKKVVRMRLRLSRAGATELTTSIEAASGHPAVIGGPRLAEGVLIIIVWANPNPDRRQRD
jgi:RNA polymerase sigma-70 factor (ECF subfamily)